LHEDACVAQVRTRLTLASWNCGNCLVTKQAKSVHPRFHGVCMADRTSFRTDKTPAKITPAVVAPRKDKATGASGSGANQPRLSVRSNDSDSLGTEGLRSILPAKSKTGSKLQESESTEESSASRKTSQGVPRFPGKAGA